VDLAREMKTSMLSMRKPFALPRGACRMVRIMSPRRAEKGAVGDAGLVVERWAGGTSGCSGGRGGGYNGWTFRSSDDGVMTATGVTEVARA
jgi:hypothetical protein